MPSPPTPRHPRWRRAVVAAVLVTGVLLMAGPPASTAVGPRDPMSGMVAMGGMVSGEDLTVLGGPSSDGAAVTACALCVDLLEECLAVLTLVVAAAMAGPGVHRVVRAGPRSRRSGRARRWAVGDIPPWSVPSLSQLSVLRV